MVINSDELKKKINYLGMSISKNVASKQTEKMIRFESDGNIVYGYTYNGINNIRVEIGTSTDDFYAIVDYTLFSNFIKSCEGDITLEPKNKFLHIKSSNVKCKLPTYNHEIDRKNTGIPTPVKNYNYDKQLVEKIDLGLIKSILDPNHIVETYRLIYFGDTIMVSDTDNVLKINKRIFDSDILLNLSSVDILNMVTNCEYTYSIENKVKLLCIKSDELYATMVITNNDNNDFQYNDFIDLFNTVNGKTVVIDSSILSKAISASSIFKTNPNIVFNNKGIFIKIDTVEFIYKISNDNCDEREFELSSDIVKKITSLGKDVVIYYTNKDLIKCESDGVSEILSIREVKTNE